MNYKRWLVSIIIAIFGILLLVILSPKESRIHETTFIRVNSKAFFRTIANVTKWQEWYPDKRFTILNTKEYSTTVRIYVASDSLVTEMTYSPWNMDSVLVVWEGSSKSTVNPFSRVQNYYRINHFKDLIKRALISLETFYSSEENIYSIKIIKEHVKDSTLIATASTSTGYPETKSIYSLINELNCYATSHKTAITGLPMLNILKIDSTHYLTRVALPVYNKLTDSGNILYRAMLGGGNILSSEVHGGISNINNAFAEMENYISDHKRTSPAIPFQSLITDRSIISDTSKWITKIYYPVM